MHGQISVFHRAFPSNLFLLVDSEFLLLRKAFVAAAEEENGFRRLSGLFLQERKICLRLGGLAFLHTKNRVFLRWKVVIFFLNSFVFSLNQIQNKKDVLQN